MATGSSAGCPRKTAMLPLLLVLQDLEVDRATVQDGLTQARLALAPVWPGEPLEDPGKVLALVTVREKIDQSVLERYPALRMVAVAFTGYDHVDLEACRARGIAVANVPDYATDAAAELALTLTLALLRQIPAADRQVRSGAWYRRESFSPGAELAGKTVGIVGTGRIGLRAAELFRAFRCPLLGWSRTAKEAFLALGGTYHSLEEIFSKADIVSLHLPAARDTQGLIGEDLLRRMKPSALLINTARGPVVDQAALARVLEEGRIRGAGLDVFDAEPLDPAAPLASASSVVLTPHIGFRTREALERRVRITIENLSAFFAGRPQNLVT
jgi:D-3-phosphoglycerate dehydrogenase